MFVLISFTFVFYAITIKGTFNPYWFVIILIIRLVEYNSIEKNCYIYLLSLKRLSSNSIRFCSISFIFDLESFLGFLCLKFFLISFIFDLENPYLNLVKSFFIIFILALSKLFPLPADSHSSRALNNVSLDIFCSFKCVSFLRFAFSSFNDTFGILMLYRNKAILVS